MNELNEAFRLVFRQEMTRGSDAFEAPIWQSCSKLLAIGYRLKDVLGTPDHER